MLFVNSKFEQPVSVSWADAEFDGCIFAAQGESKKDPAGVGIKAENGSKIKVKNSTFVNQGYEAILLKTELPVVIENNVFECANIKNPIEGSSSTSYSYREGIRDLVIKGNTFNGSCGNNYINLYKFGSLDDGCVTLEGNVFNGVDPDQNEIIRLSNVGNHAVEINVKNDVFNYSSDSVGDYTSYIMCQDYTNKSGTKQDFSKITVNLDGVKCNGEVISAENPVQGKISFTYEDGKGIIEGNDPVINFK